MVSNSFLRPALALVPLLLALVSPGAGAAVLAIDYGTDAFKASLVKPGVPFDVLINSDSKRKTGSVVTLRGEERSFGGAAANLATRFPRDTFSAVKLLLGGTAASAQAQLHRSLYPSAGSPATTPRGSPALSSSTASYSVEEILAMQFAYAKEMAELTAGEIVREAVVTVPAWFGQSERAAVLDAIELAGLKSIGLVHDGTAAAVNYAMSRVFPATASYHLLYDFGAGSLRTTLVSLKSALLPDPLSLAAKPPVSNVTSLTVHGVGFDTTVGGFALDQIIRDIMREDFEMLNKVEIGTDVRAMAKLLKEATRVKHVLSANVASVARIEGLVGDTDFRTTVTREQLESGAAELLPRFTKPIYEALADANLTIADLESVIMIGGSSRVPMVEAAVRAIVGEDKLAKNVNADEAAVMGAALYGAGITRGFRTKDIRVQDITPYAIDVAYEADKQSEDEEARIVKTHLFPALSKAGVSKTMTFKKRGDFGIYFSYAKTGLHSDDLLPDNLFETKISGLNLAYVNLTEETIANSTIQVTIELNESNVVAVTKAVLLLPPVEDESAPTINDRLKGFLGKFGSKTTEDAAADPSASAKSKSDKKGETEPTLEEMQEMLKSMKPKTTTKRLELTTVALERMPMSLEEKVDARKRLREIKAVETRKLRREEARNVLEAYIYKARDLVESSSFEEVSTKVEREEIKAQTAASGDWLSDEADDASTKELKAKKSELEKLVKHVSARSTERTQRPIVANTFHSTISAAQGFLFEARANHTASTALDEPTRFTIFELDHLEKSVVNASEWFEGKKLAQEDVKQYEDPVYTVAEVEKKARDVSTELIRLMKKKLPRKSKVVKKAAKVIEAEEEETKEQETEPEVELPVEEEPKEEIPVEAQEPVETEEPVVVGRQKDDL